jgi:hypothetical protein
MEFSNCRAKIGVRRLALSTGMARACRHGCSATWLTKPLRFVVGYLEINRFGVVSAAKPAGDFQRFGIVG